jgi:hypothetical protein
VILFRRHRQSSRDLQVMPDYGYELLRSEEGERPSEVVGAWSTASCSHQLVRRYTLVVHLSLIERVLQAELQ